MTFTILNLTQGTPEWTAHRATARNASDVPAMLGISPYKSRADLVRERATGITPEITPEQQRRFDRGHRIEALARPIAEQILGDDLSPCVGTDGTYSASFDGITFVNDPAWECKSLNDRLRAVLPDYKYGQPICDIGDELPDFYRAQMEQQAMVSGCRGILFTAASLGDDGQISEARHCWYTPDPAMRARIVAGWEQFDQDVAAWQPTEATAPVQAAPMESLPAVVVQVSGALTVGGNLDAFGQALREFIGRIPAEPETDQQFADADAACKALKKAEDALAQAEDGALAQISDVEVMRRTVADLKDLARTARLRVEKLVAAEKDARKLAIVREAQSALHEHVEKLNRDLRAKQAGSLPPATPVVFAACVKGLKSLDSMQEKVTAELIRLKAEATETAMRLHQNRDMLRAGDRDWSFLFPDFADVGIKSAEDFAALAALRTGKHLQAEAERLERERQRIEAEAKAKAEREAQAAAEAERARIRAEEQAKARAESEQRERERQAEIAARRQAANKAVQAKPLPPAVETPGRAIIPPKTGARVTLGHINALLAPVKLDAAGLAELGFELVAKDKSAKLYNEDDIPDMCRAIAEHVTEIAALQAA